MISGSVGCIDSFSPSGTILVDGDNYVFVSAKKGDNLFILCHSCSTTNVFQLQKLGGIVSLMCQQCGHPLDLRNEIQR